MTSTRKETGAESVAEAETMKGASSRQPSPARPGCPSATRAFSCSAMQADDDNIIGKSGIRLRQLRRAARLYHMNPDAATALGVTTTSFVKLCEKHGIETPLARKKRLDS